MNRDFIRLKQLQGELKLTQMTHTLGCSVTSKELVFQKPHITYHLFLQDIISMVPVTIETKNITFRRQSEWITTGFGANYYKIAVKWARIITRSGVSEKEDVEFIVPLSDKMLQYIAVYSGLQPIA